MKQLDERGTITPVRYSPRSERAIHSQLMITPKYGMDGSLTKMKGRLVASGNEVDRSNLPSTSVTKELMDREAVGDSVDQKDYLSKVMKLMYLATKTRPDILFAVSTLASRSADPKESDLRHLNRVYQYLRGTRDFKVRLKCENMELSASVVMVSTGMTLFLSGCPIFSRSSKQKTVATSSIHAEVVCDLVEIYSLSSDTHKGVRLSSNRTLSRL
jgi:hypothetical protein